MQLSTRFPRDYRHNNSPLHDLLYRLCYTINVILIALSAFNGKLINELYDPKLRPLLRYEWSACNPEMEMIINLNFTEDK